MNDLIEKFEALRELPIGAPAAAKQQRGRDFELFLKNLLTVEKLDPRIRLRPNGEEIDGSFCLNERVFLLEAKWQAKPLPASSVYTFKGKVDGKLIGTIGAFISISGFSEDSIDALTAGKCVNVILFNEDDVKASLKESFRRVLLAKLRAAAEQGVVFFPFTTTVTTVNEGQQPEIADDISVVSPTEAGEVVVVCEGAADVSFLNELSQRILAAEHRSGRIRFLAAQGKRGIPQLVNAIQPMLASSTPVIVVVDGDRQTAVTEQSISAEVQTPLAALIVIDPEIEAWAVPGVADPKSELRQLAKQAQRSMSAHFQSLASKISLEALRNEDSSFSAFYDAIIAATDA